MLVLVCPIRSACIPLTDWNTGWSSTMSLGSALLSRLPSAPTSSDFSAAEGNSGTFGRLILSDSFVFSSARASAEASLELPGSWGSRLAASGVAR
eukprot:3359914-Pyramimonas_sp.AAC.1